MKAVIHCNPNIPWQPIRAAYFAEGFRAAGIDYEITADRFRHDDGFPVLLGTSMWRCIERDGGEFLLVDRCSFGDTERFVSLVWNGHGKRGDHRIPQNYDASRWERYGVPLGGWSKGYDRVVLCGQVETYSPHFESVDAWYSTVTATHFRPHPASQNFSQLPTAYDLDNALAVTLNSSVAVKAVMQGVPTVAMDEGSMAWDVTGHSPNEFRTPDREAWCHWIAQTQFTDEEIRQGDLWASRW